MGQFRKKPVTVEARLFDGSWASGQPILAWMSESSWPSDMSLPRWSDVRESTGHLYIPTLEGEMTASAGDWIIKGVQGEFYPCKPEIFTATYDAVITEAVDSFGMSMVPTYQRDL